MRVIFTSLTAALALGSATAFAQEPLTQAALERWLAGYEAAWEERDAAAAAALFTADAEYHETPYSEPFRGREGIAAYWSGVTADQRDVDFRSRVIAVSGNVGIAQWTATFVNAPSGTPVELDGVFVLEFSSAGGLVRALREWWVLRPSAD